MKLLLKQMYIFVAALATFAALESFAIVVHLSDLHSMAQKSDVVVHGTALSQEVIWDKYQRPITLTKIKVLEGLSGANSGQVITIRQVGGQKDGVVVPIVGGQNFKIGQEVFFFGLKTGSDYVSYGAGQGKLDVIKNLGAEIIKEDLGSVGVLSADPLKPRIYPPSPLIFDNKEDLKNEIKLMLKNPLRSSYE